MIEQEPGGKNIAPTVTGFTSTELQKDEVDVRALSSMGGTWCSVFVSFLFEFCKHAVMSSCCHVVMPSCCGCEPRCESSSKRTLW